MVIATLKNNLPPILPALCYPKSKSSVLCQHKFLIDWQVTAGILMIRQRSGDWQEWHMDCGKKDWHSKRGAVRTSKYLATRTTITVVVNRYALDTFLEGGVYDHLR